MNTGFRILLTLLFTTGLLHAQVPKDREADAVYEDVRHAWTLAPGGAIDYRYDHKLKLRTHFSFDRAYGESFILTNPQWQTLAFHTTRTTMADGRQVPVPANGFNEVLPGFAAGCAPYLHLREMVVTHTGIEKGAAIHLGYSIATKEGFGPGLFGKVVLGDRSPIRSLTAVITVPRGTPLLLALRMPDGRVSAVGLSLKEGERIPLPLPEGSATLSMSVKDATIAYTLAATDLPLVPVSTAQPALDACVPTLFFSTVTAQALRTHVVGEAASRFALSAASKASLARQWKTGTAPDRIATALRQEVEVATATMGGDLALTGYRAMAAEDVLQRASGSVLDKAVLLTALERTAGLPTSLVLGILSCPEYRGDVVLPTGTAWTAVKLDGRWMLQDPAHGSAFASASPDLGETVLTVDGEPVALPSIPRPTLSLTGTLTLGADRSLTGHCVAVSSPMASDPARLATSVRKAMEAMSAGMKTKDSVVRNTDTEVRVSVLASDPLPVVQGTVRLPLPVLPGSIAAARPVLASLPRRTPWKVTGALEETVDVSIAMPAGFIPPSLPAQRMKNAAGEIESSIEKQGTTVRIRRHLVIAGARIPAADYTAFRDLMGAWLDPSWQSLTVTVSKKAGTK